MRGSLISRSVLIATSTFGIVSCAQYTARPIDVGAFKSPSVQTPALYGGSGSFEALFQQVARHHPAVRSAQEAYRAAQSDARIAGQYPPVGFTLTTEYSRQADAARPWMLGAAFDLPVDAGERRTARTHEAALNLRLARYDLSDAVFTLRSQLASALTTLQATQHLSALCDEGQTLRLRTLDQALARVRMGEEDSSAETAARLDLTSTRSACQEIETREAAAQADLAALLGVSVSDLTTLRFPAYPSGLDLPGGDLLNRRRTTSLYTRADIFKAISDYDRSENALRLAIASQYPQVRIGPGYIWERGLAKFPLTLSLVLPPADLNREAIRAAEARRAAAGASLEAVVATHYAAEQKALSDYEAALVLVQQIERQDLPITASQSKRAQDFKRLGEGTLADLLAAQAAQNSAQMRYEEARLAAGLARVQLEAVWRQPLTDEEMQSLKTLMQSLEVSP